MSARGLFVTATDTGVGKTIVTALLLAHLRSRGIDAIAMKPISSGDRRDARLLRELAGSEPSLDRINPIHFRRPLAPLVAARLESRRWDMRAIFRNFNALARRHDFVLVEGVGGLLVPLRPDYFVREFASELNLPLLIVARPALGTLNHTLLTVEAARSRRIPITGIVFNSASPTQSRLVQRTNMDVVEKLCGEEFFGHIPFLGPNGDDARTIVSAARRPDVGRVLHSIAESLLSQ